jgi:rod shape-determining protein MreD
VNWRRGLKALFIFAALVAMQYTLRPLLGWRVSVDFLVIAVLLVAVRVRPAVATVIGFFTGLVADSLTPTSLGAGALAMSAIGFAASYLKAVFFADNVVLHAFFFFVGKWAYDILSLIASRRLAATDLVSELLLWSPLAAAMTAVVGVLVLLLFRSSLEPQSV